MKAQASVKKMCEHCYLVTRKDGSGKKRVRVYCKRNPRHKQVQR